MTICPVAFCPVTFCLVAFCPVAFCPETKYGNPHIRSTWRDAWAAKEEAMRARFSRSQERLNLHSKALKPLSIGDHVFVQNQEGRYANKWDKTGVVVEVGTHDQYKVKVDGSGRVTLRNRKFLRHFKPATTDIDQGASRPGTYVPPPVVQSDIASPTKPDVPKSPVHRFSNSLNRPVDPPGESSSLPPQMDTPQLCPETADKSPSSATGHHPIAPDIASKGEEGQALSDQGPICESGRPTSDKRPICEPKRPICEPGRPPTTKK